MAGVRASVATERTATSKDKSLMVMLDRGLLRSHIFAADCLDNIIRRCAKKLRNYWELVDMVFSGKERFPLKHLGEDAPRTPNVHFNVVFLPGKHDFWCSIVSCGDIASHLRVLDTR